MTNEEKAREIAENQFSWYSEFDDVTSYEECYESALEAMDWKDEQHKQEKQQWIEKAVIFLNERVCTEMSIPEIHNMIVDFKKSMKGER